MYDRGIIGKPGYRPVEKVADIIKWEQIATQHDVKKSFPRVLRRLRNKGYVSDHGKSGKVASLTAMGVAYVEGLKDTE